MTPELLQPLHNVLIWAQYCSDPILIEEAARRFRVLDREIALRNPLERELLEESVFRMLPSDWPLWMESRRDADACVLSATDRLLQN